LEMPRPTSTLFSRAGWPLLGIGVIFWIAEIFMPRPHFLVVIPAIGFVGLGVVAVAISFFSAHSEGVEESERARRIRDRSTSARCLYLEGNVPDGKGTVGRCTLYQFDMVDLPYCLYCKEYSPVKGSPEV